MSAILIAAVIGVFISLIIIISDQPAWTKQSDGSSRPRLAAGQRRPRQPSRRRAVFTRRDRETCFAREEHGEGVMPTHVWHADAAREETLGPENCCKIARSLMRRGRGEGGREGRRDGGRGRGRARDSADKRRGRWIFSVVWGQKPTKSKGESAGAVDTHDAPADVRDPPVHPFLCSFPCSSVGRRFTGVPTSEGLNAI